MIQKLFKTINQLPILGLMLALAYGGYYILAHYFGDRSGSIDTAWINIPYIIIVHLLWMAVAFRVVSWDKFTSGNYFKNIDDINLSDRYNPVIDGLRAVAVIAVLLYHAGVAGFEGGFIGVDVFFVISGYLISGHILKELRAGKFSFKRFYEKRVRRILPALTVMTIATIAVSAWLYDPETITEVSLDGIASITSWANIRFWSGDGYFAASPITQPFLHAWSLSVEEQFYLLLPMFLYFIYKAGQKAKLPHYILGVMLYSVIASGITVYTDQNTAFYWLHTRAWELLAGALLIFLPELELKSTWSKVLPYIGISLILVPIFLYNDSTPFPGIAAILPVLGSAMIIKTSNKAGNYVNKALASPPFKGVGKISYSLYLWHWPILVLAWYYNIFEPTPTQLTIEFVGIFVVSWASWYFVEMPFRSSSTMPTRRLFAILVPMISALLVVFVVLMNHVVDVRALTHPGVIYPDKKSWNAGWEKWDVCTLPKGKYNLEEIDLCVMGNPEVEPTFLLIGDSHAQVMAEGMSIAAGNTGRSGLLLVTPGQPPIFDARRIDDGIKSILIKNELIKLLNRYPINQVFLTARWVRYIELCSISFDGHPVTCEMSLSNYSKGLSSLIDLFLDQEIHVHVIDQTPSYGFDIPACVNASLNMAKDPFSTCSISLSEHIEDNQSVQTMLHSVMGERSNVGFIATQDLLCDDKNCYGYYNGAPLYFDSHHLSIIGSKLFVSKFEDALK